VAVEGGRGGIGAVWGTFQRKKKTTKKTQRSSSKKKEEGENSVEKIVEGKGLSRNGKTGGGGSGL